MKLLWLHLLVYIQVLLPHGLCTKNSTQRENHHVTGNRRVKRGWIWNEMSVTEEQIQLPFYVGKLRSDKRNGVYALEGEFSNSIFKVNEDTGDIQGYQRLDREKKATYTLTALLIDKNTRKTLEEPGIFIIRLIDINDNSPLFTQETYNASIPEMSPLDKLVIKVTAVDADDPTISGHATVRYTILQGYEKFRIDENTGSIYPTATNLDRETQASYELILQAKDMPGHNGGLSSTAKVIVHLSDINDNYPVFTKNSFTFEVPEDRRVGEEVGKISVEDIDEPQNRNTKYKFLDERYQQWFEVRTNAKTNEGIIILKKPLDYESIYKEFKVDIEATDPTIDRRASPHDRSKSITRVLIKVLDVDEPPEFMPPVYNFAVMENLKETLAGAVKAVDPDAAKKSVRYSLKEDRDDIIISDKGSIFIKKPFDREVSAWQNITVIAEEIDSYPRKASSAPVYIQVLDENDNAPELAAPYNPRVCETVNTKHVIINITATDKDDMGPGMKFIFFSKGHEDNFTVQDNRDNTASVIVKKGTFNRDIAKFYLLPIIITDNGRPPQSSTNTLTINICKCNEKGEFTFCEEAAKLAAVSVSTIAIVLVSIFLILLVVLAVLFIRKMQSKNPLILGKNPAEIHEQLVTYDEEGGGEMDTNSYDVSVLNSVRRNVVRPKHEVEPGPAFYAQVQKPSRNGDMFSMIEAKKEDADNDGQELPYDTLHIFGYEGSESIVESLSSLESGSSDSEIDYDVLNEWGPRFKMLADLYGLEHLEGFSY
ncbi:cadherin-5 [Hyperolius riggenbachi]|uniref:cadherin-5 n=1 Tax=Hyperolius riggenbachi TaxID=752182 RepID=UPI0035A3A7AF